jgi:hypothetical protein
MKSLSVTLMSLSLLLLAALSANAQERLTFTGTALIYGSGMNTRTVTRNFTLRLKGTTSDQAANRALSTLQENGQDALRRSIRNEDLGTFSVGNQPALTVNAARIDNVGGRQRIRAVLERWIGFGELRGGYRSVDYPFSYIEILVDPRTGRGEGTFIPAAQIRFKTRNGESQVEIEDFGTFPGRLMGVSMRGRLPQ